MTRIALSAAFALACAALPAAADERDLEVDCQPTEGGAACTVAWDTERTLFCMAVGRSGAPIASSTVSSDAGRAVFNRLDAGQIAAMRCREV